MAEHPHRIRMQTEDTTGTQHDKADIQTMTRAEPPSHVEGTTLLHYVPRLKEGHNQDDYGGLGNVYTRFRKPFGFNQLDVQHG